MKKKTVVKIVLDAAMLIAIALMYSKQALGISFHEIGGLILIGVFFIHKGLNFSWIAHVTRRLRDVNGRARLRWIVDALMLVSFLTVGISGILISKIAFPGLAVPGGPWKVMHYFAAALSLILVGVHLGMHWMYLKGILGRRVRAPRVVALALAAVLLAYGVYGIATTSFVRWLSMPFTSSAQGGSHGDQDGRFPGAPGAPSASVSSSQTADAASQTADSTGQTADAASQTADSASQTADSAGQTADTAGQTADSTSRMADTAGQTAGEASQTADDADLTADSAGQTADDASQTADTAGQTDDTASQTADTPVRTSRQGFGGDRAGGPGGQSGSVWSALKTFLQFFSIAFVFSALTALIGAAMGSKKRQAA